MVRISSTPDLSAIAQPKKAANNDGPSFFTTFKNVILSKEINSAGFFSNSSKTNLITNDFHLNIPNLVQGQNESGPTSLAMVLQYFGLNADQHTLFDSCTVGKGALALKQMAENCGLAVRQQNNGTLDDLAALIDKGIAPIVLGIYGGGENCSLSGYINNASRGNWMVVTGYKKDDNGNITHIYFNDPNRGETQCWTAADFLNKFWNNNLLPDGHCYYMGVAKLGSFQEAALKTQLPGDKVSETFKATLETANRLEETFYAGESISDLFGLATKEALTSQPY